MTTNNKQTAMDDYGNEVSFFYIKEEPVWNNGFVFEPVVSCGKTFTRIITGAGMKGWKLIPA